MEQPTVVTALEELASLPQWVCWRIETRGGKETKVPYNPRVARYDLASLPPMAGERFDEYGEEINYKASSTDPRTWSTRVQAERCLENSKKWKRPLSGLGFVLANGICGVDLDGCRNPETGEIAEWARREVERLASYTEITPSGTGLHILLRGELPGPGRKRFVPEAPVMAEGRQPAIEVYDHGRYFTVTGDRLDGTPETIEERHAELDTLIDTWFQDLPETSGMGSGEFDPSQVGELTDEDRAIFFGMSDERREKIAPYYMGDWLKEVIGKGKRYPSPSEARYALLGLLSDLTRDREQIFRLFQMSPLYTWDPSKCNRVTPGEIDKVLRARAWEDYHEIKEGDWYSQDTDSKPEPKKPKKPNQPASPAKAPRLSFLRVGPDINELQNLPPREDLIGGVWPAGSMGTLVGESNVGKTVVMLDMVMSVLTETSWQGQAVKETACGDIIWLAGEGLSNLRDLVEGWMTAYPERRLHHHLHVLPHGIPLGADAQILIDEARRDLAGRKAALFVVDTLSKNFGAGDPDKTQDMGRFCQSLLKISSAFNAAVVALHHTPWSGERERGSSLLRGDVETTWLLKRGEGGAGGVRLECQKMKGIGMAPRNFHITQASGVRETEEGPRSYQYATLHPAGDDPMAWRGPKLTKKQREYIDLIAGSEKGLTRKEIEDSFGVTQQATQKHLKFLIDIKAIECVDGVLQLTEAGQKWHPWGRLRIE